MYIKNSNSPKTNPCGTPLVTTSHLHLEPLIVTLCCLGVEVGVQYQVKREDDGNIDHVENCSDTLEMALKVEGGLLVYRKTLSMKKE